MSDELLTIDEVADRIRRTPGTVRHWIATGTELGPRFAKLGRRRMARAADVEAWLSECFGA